MSAGTSYISKVLIPYVRTTLRIFSFLEFSTHCLFTLSYEKLLHTYFLHHVSSGIQLRQYVVDNSIQNMAQALYVCLYAYECLLAVPEYQSSICYMRREFFTNCPIDPAKKVPHFFSFLFFDLQEHSFNQ